MAGSSSSSSNISHVANSTNSTDSRLSVADNNSFSDCTNVDEFQLHLMKQCLCHICEESLRRAFSVHYHVHADGTRRYALLPEWPDDKLIQFLSNIELLFETYLNQNAKGEICTRVMQVCDVLMLHEKNYIDDIFELNDHPNQFVRYLAVKVLANCMLFAKDRGEASENLQRTLLNSLCTNYAPTDRAAIEKVAFALGIMLHIMEWKDIKKHPLDDQIVINGREVYNDSDNENFTIPMEIPPIQLNPFALHLQHNAADINEHHAVASAAVRTDAIDEHEMDVGPSPVPSRPSTCKLEYLSDSESFDTKELKFSLTQLLRTKWSRLVNDMGACIGELQRNRSLHYIENTVMTFLNLWERIINVDTCLSFESTLPFHEALVPFERILVGGNLPVQVYKQILTLFSASLCYTTTLALQNEVPNETNRLANEIFNDVKNRRMFSSLPTHETNTKTDMSFIGGNYATVVYGSRPNAVNSNGEHVEENGHSDDDEDGDSDNANDDDDDDVNSVQKSIDFMLLQKLVLLILKAIVVTVRPIRSGDSSDSSMDSCSSTSSIGDQDAQAVGRITRDVIKELKSFLRSKLSHHPETHLSKVIVHLFNNQDDYLIEAMLCMLGTTVTFLPRQAPFGSISRQSSTSTTSGEHNHFHELIDMISPVYTFLEFLELINYNMETMLDFLITDETCFLLYFLRFLKYIRNDWQMFQDRCNDWLSTSNTTRPQAGGSTVLEDVMSVLTKLRLKIDRLVRRRLFPYDITPLTSIMRQCEGLYEGNEHELF